MQSNSKIPFQSKHHEQYLKRVAEEKRLEEERKKAEEERIYQENLHKLLKNQCEEISKHRFNLELETQLFSICETIYGIEKAEQIEEVISRLVEDLTKIITQHLTEKDSNYISILGTDGEILKSIESTFDCINMKLEALGVSSVVLNLMDTSLDTDYAKIVQEEWERENTNSTISDFDISSISTLSDIHNETMSDTVEETLSDTVEETLSDTVEETFSDINEEAIDEDL